jgi:hypothetical protein
MTNAEYYSEYAGLRRKLAQLTLSERKKLLEVYTEAAKQAGEVLKSTLTRDLSSLTAQRWQDIETQLYESAQLIADYTDSSVKQTLSTGFSYVADIEKSYITSAAEIAGVSLTGLSSVYAGINNKLITSVALNVYNGVGYSTRVWGKYNAAGQPIGVYGDWLDKVRSLTSAGIAQGRDPVAIARDLQAYVRGGVQTIGRWGELKPGTARYVARLGSAGVDYRALRLVRTELGKGVQEGTLEAGEANPACNGTFNWVMQSGREHWNCLCPDYAAGGPYTAETIRGFDRHPDCMCIVTQNLTSRGEFLQSLKDYVHGVDSAGARGIEEWSQKYGVSVSED